MMTIFFPDVSHYNAGVDITGAAAVVAKATQGTTYVDPSYVTFRQRAQELGIPFAGYHWVTTDFIADQARLAHGVLGATPTMWDCEAAGATVPRIVALTGEYRALGGNPRLVYLPHWWWQQLGSPDLTPLAAAGLGLVSSNYTTYSDAGPGWQPYGNVQPVIWQYTDAAPMGGMHVDMNADRGTIADLRALLGLTTGGDMSAVLVVEDDGPNVRSVWLSNGVTRRAVQTVPEMTALKNAGIVATDVPEPVSHVNLAMYGVDVATLTGGAPVDATELAGALMANPTFLEAIGNAAAGATTAKLGEVIAAGLAAQPAK